MAEFSFPVLEKPLTDVQWKSVTLGIGSGVLDEGGGPYFLRLNNIGDTGTIQVDAHKGFAHAIVAGFYHYMDSATTVSLPPVQTTTKYIIGLCYDPLKKETPVTLQVARNTLDYSSGKEWLVLHEVTRRPNQLLSDATQRTLKPAIAPSLSAGTVDALPPADRALLGTTAYINADNSIYRTSGEGGTKTWRRITGSDSVAPLEIGGWTLATTQPKGIRVSPAQGAWECNFAGQLVRAAETYRVSPSAWSTLGTFIPASLRTSTTQTMPFTGTYFHGAQGVAPIGMYFNFQTGTISLRSMTAENFEIRQGSSITFNITWSAARTTSSW